MKIAIGLVVMVFLLCLRKAFMLSIVRRREEISTNDLMSIFKCGEKGIEGLRFLGKIYSLSPGVFRPNDAFRGKSAIAQYDSWNLNSGYIELRRFVQARGGVLCDGWCVSDFVNWYEGTK